MFDTRTGKPVGSLDDEKAKAADEETPESWWPLRRAIGSVQSLAFSPDGRLLAVCGSSFTDFSDIFDRVERGGLGRHVSGPGRLKVFDAKTGALKHDLAGHSHVFDVAFSSDASLLASAGRWEDASGHGNGAIIWNPQTGEKIRTLQIEANGGTQYVAFSPNKKLIVTGSVRFDKENDTKSTSIAVTYPLSGITEWTQTVPGWSKPAFTSDGKSIAILCGRESIRLVSAETGQLQHEMKVTDALPGGKWNDFAALPDISKLAIGGTDASGKGVVAIWRPGDSQSTQP
jgi:WD40 repeat protein